MEFSLFVLEYADCMDVFLAPIQDKQSMLLEENHETLCQDADRPQKYGRSLAVLQLSEASSLMTYYVRCS